MSAYHERESAVTAKEDDTVPTSDSDTEKDETFFDQVMELIYTVGTGEGYDGNESDGNSSDQDDKSENGDSDTESDVSHLYRLGGKYCASLSNIALGDNENGDLENSITRIEASRFQTRIGPNYIKRKQKSPSAPALLELMSADWVRTPHRVKDITDYLNIPAEWADGVNSHHDNIPPLFIINAQVPYDWSTSLFTEATDGTCYALVMVFRLTKTTCDALMNLGTAPPAVKLFAQYCLEAPEAYERSAAAAVQQEKDKLASSSHGSGRLGFSVSGLTSGLSGKMSGKEKRETENPWGSRAKFCLRCENIDALGLPGFLHQYNGKPLLLRESGFLTRGKGCLEYSINVRKFGMLATNTLPMMLSRMHHMELSVAFMVESRDDDEMPEGVYACCGVHKLSADTAKVPLWFGKKKKNRKGT